MSEKVTDKTAATLAAMQQHEDRALPPCLSLYFLQVGREYSGTRCKLLHLSEQLPQQ